MKKDNKIEILKREILHQKDYYEGIIAKMPGHVYWKDKHGVFIGCNDQQAKTLGLKSRHDVVGKKTLDLIAKNQPLAKRKRQAKLIDQTDQQIMASGISKTLEEPLITPEGKKAIYISTKTPIYDNENEVMGILGISMDITEQKQAITDKINAEKDKEILKKQVESLELMANTVAHELRTPLSTITGGLYLLKDKICKIIQIEELSNDKEYLLEIINELKKQVDQTQTFINIILENAKDIESIKLEPIDINSIITSSINDYPYNNESHKNLIHFDPTTDLKILGDQHLFKHVILNLLKNSLFFIEKNNKGEIYITANKNENTNIITFEDTAEGIDKNQLSKLFNDYYTKTGVGTGIGLGFCKRVISAFNGNISCESKKGEYMRFIMKFPKL